MGTAGQRVNSAQGASHPRASTGARDGKHVTRWTSVLLLLVLNGKAEDGNTSRLASAARTVMLPLEWVYSPGDNPKTGAFSPQQNRTKGPVWLYLAKLQFES